MGVKGTPKFKIFARKKRKKRERPTIRRRTSEIDKSLDRLFGKKGFTVIELMLVVAIITTIAAIVIPLCGNSIRKSREALTKGNLGTIRSAIAIYYGLTDGVTPSDDLTSLIESGALRAIPIKSTPPYHPDGNSVSAMNFSSLGPSRGDWAFDNNPLSPTFGAVAVNCTHTDLRGVVWTAY